jgi:NDP-sugar pyrophosphorylase family protein
VCLVRGSAGGGERGGGHGLRALVLAAGAGTRLRALTDVLPKPLAPVGGRPVVARLIDRLGQCDLDTIALNLHHGADLIERVVGAGPVYLREEWLRGTAGALVGAAEFLAADDFLVASADGVHEIDLGALIATHRQSGAAATITVKRIARPETCAIVALDDGDLVQWFVEKPRPGEVFTDLASIGVYCFAPEVLELIPRDQPYDIAGQLIPRMLESGLPVRAYETDAWWTDVGDSTELLAANLHFGEVLDSDVAPDARIEAPVMIGPHSRVEAAALVSRALVLPGAVVPAGAEVVNGIHGTGTDVVEAWLR